MVGLLVGLLLASAQRFTDATGLALGLEVPARGLSDLERDWRSVP